MSGFAQLIRTVVFSHFGEDGKQRHFNIDLLTLMVKAAMDKGLMDVLDVQIDPGFAENCLVYRGIEQHRLDRIDVHYFQTPLFFCENVATENTHLLVDGHHRYVWAWQQGWETVPAVSIPQLAWERVLIPLPDMDKDATVNSFSGIR